MALRILVARFPYGNVENPDLTDWLVKTAIAMKADRRIAEVIPKRYDDTPITMTRNRACLDALTLGCDLILMLDSDMAPDLRLPDSKPFFESSLDFMLDHKGPCMVAAPYCGPPPHENVYIFHWESKQSDNPNVDLSLVQYTREQSIPLAGIQEVAALPTGVMLIDTRVFKHLKPAWFDYEYEDPPYNTRKSTTEDVFFTRNASLAGIPVYCNWDSWAGHHKRKLVGKPSRLSVESVRQEFREALLSGRSDHEKLIDVVSLPLPKFVESAS